MKIEREIAYFAEHGPQHTEDVIETVKKRLEKGDVTTVVVASTSGETGVTFSEKLEPSAHVIVVSHKEMQSMYKQQITELGGKFVEKTHLPLHTEGKDEVRETFRMFGQGFKVAVEVILIAADKKEVNLYEDIIGVGGTGKGSDTAIIARATTTEEIFTKDESKKLEIREILTMPLKKKWW